MALGVEPGDEVILPSYTFFATASAVTRLGAVPIFADIDPRTYLVDPADVERKISRRTRAIIPVHLFGRTADMDALLPVAARAGIPVVEDAAQSILSTWHGRCSGALGDVGCLGGSDGRRGHGAGIPGVGGTKTPWAPAPTAAPTHPGLVIVTIGTAAPDK